jgi:alpha-N-arabinofuranosidase
MRRASLTVLVLGLATTIASCSSGQGTESQGTTGGEGPGAGGGSSTGGAAATCGNGVLDPGETCDPPSSCNTNCSDDNGCTTDRVTGTPNTCDVACVNTPKTNCVPNDDCCPSGCDSSTDSDCSTTCGNGVLDDRETCDPPGSCPATCDDNDACTADQTTGSADNCNVACSHTPVTACTTGDGCCPSGCNATADADCTDGVGGAGVGGTPGVGGETLGGSGGTAGDTGGTAPGGSGGTTGGAATGGSNTGGGDTGGGNTGGGATGGAGGEAPQCPESDVTDSPNTLGVNVSAPGAVVSKEIFGLLMETLGNDVNNGVWVGTNSSIPNTAGVRDDIIAGMAEAGVGAIEWPGGCAANNFNWQANLSPSNTMGVDRFMDFVGEVGAEAVLVGRPAAQYADSNRQWIEYVNNNSSHPDWNLKYFKIGNEVWGCGGNLGHDAAAEASYEAQYNANYDLLSAPVNGKELFLVAGTAGIWTVDPNNSNDWINLILGSIGEKIDGIEVHDYIYYPDSVPCVGFSDDEYYDIVYLAGEGQMAPRIDQIRTILDRNDPSGRVQIIEDEWGDWLQNFDASDDWLQQGTVMDALSAAITLNVFMANADRVRMAGLAQAVNVIHSLFLTNSRGGGSDLVKTPTFYVFKQFIPHHTNGARWAPNTLSSEKITGNNRSFNVLSSGATVNDAGQVSISLANVDLTSTRDVTITLDSAAAAYAMVSANVVTGPAKDSYNDFGKAETVNSQPLDPASYQLCGRKLKVTLPSKSVVTLTLDPR